MNDATVKSQNYGVGAFVKDLQAGGRYWFTRDEVLRALPQSPVAVEAGLRRLKKQRRLVVPRRGFNVIVPTEYRQAGSPPVSWFINDLMAFLGQPYYVGLLSAASIWGAAHQQPMVFQVMTDRPTREFVVGRARVRFHVRKNVFEIPTRATQTETGEMLVSTPEATALDLVHYMSVCGGVGNVATVLHLLAESIDRKALVARAEESPTPDVQRLGYLISLDDSTHLSEALSLSLLDRSARTIHLVPGAAKQGALRDDRWRVLMDEPVEMDL